MGYVYGHFENVSGMQWMMKQSKKKKNVYSDVWSVVHATNDCFVTCSHDMSIFVWKHFGDRWSFSYIDVVKCFD